MLHLDACGAVASAMLLAVAGAKQPLFKGKLASSMGGELSRSSRAGDSE